MGPVDGTAREAAVLPAAFLERLQRMIPPSQWDAVLRTFTQPKPTTFRVNTLKADSASIRQQLEASGFRLETVPWNHAAFTLRNGQLRNLQETPCYQRGEIYVQSLASMLPALVLDPQPDERVLDLTAAPGSKTTQIACLMRGRGRLVANDNNRIRGYKLQANVKQQGAANVEISRRHGEAFGKVGAEPFDRVLVDAPCGTEGRFFTGRPSSYNYWKPRKIHEMVVKQRRLLEAGARALRLGGVLVYSTCTFAPEENEGVVNWVLGRFDGALDIEPIVVPIPNTMPGLTVWEEKVFCTSLSRTVRVLPTDDMEGFFVARLKKRDS